MKCSELLRIAREGVKIINMTILIKKISVAIATLALLFNSLTSVAFATTLEISGNGSNSENEIEVEVEQETTVVQQNNAKIENKIEASANTGDNEVKDNTGGDTTIETGDATTTVNVTNQANANVADVGCQNCPVDTEAVISGNGSGSENEIEIELENETEVYQKNNADIKNEIEAESNTGDNEIEDNTGGSVSLSTGDAETSVSVNNTANANVASVGNGNNGDKNGQMSARIVGNGSDSENEIELETENSVLIVQQNEADIENEIEAEANTGDNEIEDNTGGDITLETGDAETNVGVDNWVNFNWANVDCCIFDLLAKISGNGSDSENEIEAELENELEVYQENCGKDDKKDGWEQDSYRGDYDRHDKCEIENDIEAESETGDNEVEDNTGPVEDDPIEISTGDAETGVEVSNSANLNIFSQSADDDADGELNDLINGLDLQFSFDLSELLALWHSLNNG